MTIDNTRFKKLLEQFDLKKLFNELGWDNPKLQPQVITAKNGQSNEEFTLTNIAHKRGVTVFLCSPDSQGSVPERPVMLKVEKEATKLAHEHLLVFADKRQSMLTWLWVARTPGQPTNTRTHTWHKGQSGEALRQKLEQIVWSIDKEEGITLTTVITGLRNAFDRDRVSKRFYDNFKQQHEFFAEFVEGLAAASDRQWYASLMLNRLMFVYFIQKKGFLDGDTDYLTNRLEQVKQLEGKDKFHIFYRLFLMRLFQEGLGQPQPTHSSELKKLIGKVPYLNGGLFSLHELEKNNPDIDIPDEAFARLFEFFGKWDWHLDDRPLAKGNEINPDVLGYIFEKYINQKQMGAYYTKEDITEYICKNTVVPHLIDQARNRCTVAFEGEDSVWNRLKADPERYIYPSMKLGVIDTNGNLVPESALPDFVQQGMTDPDARMFERRYNLGEAQFSTATRERGTLPTETWREYADRRSRCLALRERLALGLVKNADELITLNLDIRQFMQDVIDNTDSPDLLRAIWQAIVGRVPEKSGERFRYGITILDPTCGSGAFLFAALGVLEPLYEACLERMEGFVEDAKRLGRDGPSDFTKVLHEVGKHPSRRYYIFKCIILHNLFGVDIMAEAVEICKLRLFLKLVSQVERGHELEPLPDIDFNIRAGNTLVGYATEAQFDDAQNLNSDKDLIAEIKAETADLADSFDRFREQQTVHSGQVTANDKRRLSIKLSALCLRLDRFLARDCGIDPDKPRAFAKWRDNHQPFHWFAEFYRVMREGGFDVVIGNPPYVATNKASYTVRGYETAACTDIYAWCLERVTDIASSSARTGMIVPLSLSFSGDFDVLRKMIYERYQLNWFSHFAKRPSMLFSGVQVRNAIHIGRRGVVKNKAYTTKLHRWHSEARAHLFNQVCYSSFSAGVWPCVPKGQGEALLNLLEKKYATALRMSNIFSKSSTEYPLFFKKIGYNWVSFGEFIPPAYSKAGSLIEQNEFGIAYVKSKIEQKMALLFLNGKIAFAYWILLGDDFHLTKGNFFGIPFDFTKISNESKISNEGKTIFIGR